MNDQSPKRPKYQRARTTLQQVADRAGVSRTTASFVLNGRDEMRISAAAQERVKRAARELDYRPNLMARSLKTQLTRTVALLSDGVATDGYGGEMIRGAVEASVAAEHMLYIGEFEGDSKVRTELIRGFVDRQVDGFIYASSSGTALDLPDELDGHPVVAVNCVPENRQTTAVVSDDLGGGTTAAEHLLELGHRNDIWIVGETPSGKYVAEERRRGFEERLAADGVTTSGSIDCNWWPESTYEAVNNALDAGHRPRAMLCLNDRVALGAYQALKGAGWSIPEDITLVSFDDSPMASWVQPTLTSVAMPYFRMATQAVEFLLAGKDNDGVHRVSMPLRARGSSAAPRP